jgi:hypothetical protein
MQLKKMKSRLVLDNVISFNKTLKDKQVSHYTLKQYIDKINIIKNI